MTDRWQSNTPSVAGRASKFVYDERKCSKVFKRAGKAGSIERFH